MNYKFESKNYIHFDNKKEYNEKTKNYVIEFENNPKHNFFPLISDEIVFEKFIDFNTDENVDFKIRNTNHGPQEVPVKDKKRPIKYAAHMDNYIFKYYGIELNEKYNEYAVEKDFDDCSIAYRSNKKGKCNIHFSADVIDFINKNDGCYIYVGDFSDFFDTLDHKYLKEKIKKLYSNNIIPKHQYVIYKNITKYSYIEKKDIEFYLSNESYKYERGKGKFFENYEDFRALKKEITKKEGKEGTVLQKNENFYGVPQGTAISSIYSNIYMMDADEYINKKIKDLGGLYRRYSDDYIIILPNVNEETFYEIKNKIDDNLINVSKLKINNSKTQLMKYKNGKLVNLDLNNNCSLDYLGFKFDGKTVKIREKSIYNYYRSAYKLIGKGIFVSCKKGHTGKKARLTYKRKLYQKYHLYGERTEIKYNYKSRKYPTFISYVYKCQRIFDKISPNTNNIMKKQIDNHVRKLENKISRAMKFLKNYK